MSGLSGGIVVGVLILAGLFVILLVLGCARAAGRTDWPTQPDREDPNREEDDE